MPLKTAEVGLADLRAERIEGLAHSDQIPVRPELPGKLDPWRVDLHPPPLGQLGGFGRGGGRSSSIAVRFGPGRCRRIPRGDRLLSGVLGLDDIPGLPGRTEYGPDEDYGPGNYCGPVPLRELLEPVRRGRWAS